jgi:hypothetical protein
MTDDDTAPESGMATGNDEPNPGEPLSGVPLSSDELRVLAELERPASGPAVAPVEESDAAEWAVVDDAPLPAPGGDEPAAEQDPDAPQFLEPPGD